MPAPTVDLDRTGARITRRERWRARALLWDESSLPRVRDCGRAVVTSDQLVGVRVSSAGGPRIAGYSGVATCGSVWACPCCSAKVAAERSAEVAAAVDAWHARGGTVAHLVLTMRHRAGQSLRSVWDGLSGAWAACTSGRGWKDHQARYGALMPRTVRSGRRKGQTVTELRVGTVRVVEVNVGDNGWHVHLHVLLFLAPPASWAGTVDDLAGFWWDRWSTAVTAAGFSASRAHGVSLRLVGPDEAAGLGDYFAKSVYSPAEALGMEATRGQHKRAKRGNRTPFQLLADLLELGVADDLELWHEWERGSKGRRQLAWSVGLREFLGLRDERTDEDIAEDEHGGETVAYMPAPDYRRLVRDRQAAALLDVMELGGLAHAQLYAAGRGVHLLDSSAVIREGSIALGVPPPPT